MGSNLTKRIHEFGSSIIILIILAGVLGFYLLKYVPERRTEFNRNAFLELNQIEIAFQFQNSAYYSALQLVIQQNHVDPASLSGFNYKPKPNQHFGKGYSMGQISFEQSTSGTHWKILFPVDSAKIPVDTLSKNLSTVMSGLVSTYRDIFDSYLLIKNPDSSNINKKNENQEAKIIYRPQDLSLDLLVNADSLLKINQGFSLMNIHDVTIAGNPYKLFLYPFIIGSQQLTIVGLISDSNYRQANQKIPFAFFAFFIILLLLLVIHLPILKIYILGPNERIRDTDIRLIIGSYFVAAFFAFFLFIKIFLDKEQSVQNRKHLKILSENIIDHFKTELDSIDRQLCFFDRGLDSLCSRQDTAHLNAMKMHPSNKAIHYLDSLFKPRIYPYPNNVFWISDSGSWVARWGFKKSLNKSPLIDVSDRQYFQDFKKREALLIPGITDSLSIQPNLSKLEGEYVITVAKHSTVGACSIRIKKDSSFSIKPFLIGLSSKMHSVSGILMPPGYGYSIISDTGNILYDSRAGRPLLSNFLREVEDPGAIQQTVVYRNKRYFENLMMQGKNMALLSTPIKGMPYQLLVYYNLFRSDGFQEHLIGLSAGMMGIVISLLIFSALVNQWSKTKTRILESNSHHFEWLHPSAEPLKQKYYVHMIRWMLWLLAAYLLAWVIVEAWFPRSEFSLLFISLLFPFYIALHYYELRERYYDVQENRTGVNWYFSRPSLLLRGLLLIIILFINCLHLFNKYSSSDALPVLIVQLAWAMMIADSAFRFRKLMVDAKTPDGELIPEMPVENKKPELTYKIPVAYIWAILTGVMMVSVLPASGIFWLLFRQEKGLYMNSDQLIMARQIDQRRQEINPGLTDYKFDTTNPADLSYISDKKFKHGIYMVSGHSTANDFGTSYDLLRYPSPEFIRLHRQIFPYDSLVLAWIGRRDSAADGTWYFGKDTTGGHTRPALIFRNRKDEINPVPFHLTADASSSWNTVGLLAHSFSGTGRTFLVFYIVGLCFMLTLAYFITLSLTKRIFLLELQQVLSHNNFEKYPADECYQQNNIGPNIKRIIFETGHEIHKLSKDPKPYQFPIVGSAYPTLLDIYHFEKKLPLRMLEAKLPQLVNELKPVYRTLWRGLTGRQKFILFYFAQDGFGNYKTGRDLQELVEKGLLFFDDLRLSVMTLSFQEYVLQMKNDPDINEFMINTTRTNTWKSFKSPLLIILTAVGIFIFITQDEVYKKITGLLTTLTSLLPLLTNMFSKSAGKSSDS